ncbi:radical SAM family heme chaperone HemW [Antarctobacter heliothermus]|uniref:Heme chaperone HemW n=1 Tax=Antarctobacter heliothermus TaxID=74033 RepID=A0A239BQS9_9RHOB|nr:radical SAM family heme chaperone HemW [Antarctobacter heliothermus]SNS10360.1 oxygen-independent coproporphyrinogen-3 oxidase [Antarctobacter heliothermus]
MRFENLWPGVLTQNNLENWQIGGFGLYVHWPFCEAKCPYCDFNSHVVSHVDQGRWARALADEIRRAGAETSDRVLGSIFFGGGTPSLMTPETVSTVIEAARDCWTFANDIEITLEANPRSVEVQRFEGYARAGVNRVSLGVQALHASDLKRLGRLHDVDEAKTALAVARSVFERVSFDLIYARQNQTLDDWRSELGEALDMAVDHLSLYQLTVEEGTAFWDRARAGGLRGLPGEDLAADMYEVTQDLCSTAGYTAYEVSNHARPGAQSRHNLIYWRYGDWLGIGPGAHGRLGTATQRVATVAWRQPGLWLQHAEAGSGLESRAFLDVSDQAGEYLMMGLRLDEGLDIERLHRLDSTVAGPEAVAELVDLDLVLWDGPVLRTTAKGRLVLNSVVAALLP